MKKFRLIKRNHVLFAPNSYIDRIEVMIQTTNGVYIQFTPLVCEYIYKRDYESYTLKCCSLKADKILMDLYKDNFLFFNNKISLRKAVGKIIEKYFED